MKMRKLLALGVIVATPMIFALVTALTPHVFLILAGLLNLGAIAFSLALVRLLGLLSVVAGVSILRGDQDLGLLILA